MNADGKQRYLVKGGSAVWSPDGTRIAYLAEGEPGGTQVWVRYMDAEGSTLQVTGCSRSPANIKWSPDGKWIGFSAFVPAADNWRIDMPPRRPERSGPRPRASWAHSCTAPIAPVPGRRLQPSLHGAAHGRDPTPDHEGEWNVGGRSNGIPAASAWMDAGRPDVVFEGNDDPKAEMCYRCANIYAIDVASGAMRRLHADAGWWSSPSVSPDGRTIAFTGAPESKDSYRALTLYTMSIDGTGRTPRHSGARPRSRSRSSGGPTRRDSTSRPRTWDQQPLVRAARRSRAPAHHRHPHRCRSRRSRRTASPSRCAAMLGSARHRRLDVKKPATLTQLTELNADLMAGTRVGEVEEIWYTSSGGAQGAGLGW
jgi:hypothetical protein